MKENERGGVGGGRPAPVRKKTQESLGFMAVLCALFVIYVNISRAVVALGASAQLAGTCYPPWTRTIAGRRYRGSLESRWRTSPSAWSSRLWERRCAASLIFVYCRCCCHYSCSSSVIVLLWAKEAQRCLVVVYWLLSLFLLLLLF